MANEESATFERRKFTITETLDAVLVKLAEQHYQGNVSLCLRAAIEDHRATLNGTNAEMVAQQLNHRIEAVQDQQDQIVTALETLEKFPQHEQRDSEQIRSVTAPTEVTDFESRILEVLVDVDDELRLSDLAEQLDVRTSLLAPALGNLVDRGFVIATGATPKRFHLAGTTSDSQSGYENEFLN